MRQAYAELSAREVIALARSAPGAQTPGEPGTGPSSDSATANEPSANQENEPAPVELAPEETSESLGSGTAPGLLPPNEPEEFAPLLDFAPAPEPLGTGAASAAALGTGSLAGLAGSLLSSGTLGQFAIAAYAVIEMEQLLQEPASQ